MRESEHDPGESRVEWLQNVRRGRFELTGIVDRLRLRLRRDDG